MALFFSIILFSTHKKIYDVIYGFCLLLYLNDYIINYHLMNKQDELWDISRPMLIIDNTDILLKNS